MCRGEHVDLRSFADIGEPAHVGGIVERVVSEAPAGERAGVAVHDADPQTPDPCHQMHGQRAEPGACMGAGLRAQLTQDDVGTVHRTGVDVGRIGAAAAGADIAFAGDFGFDIAAQRAIGRDGAFDLLEPAGLGVEPVEIAIEDQHRRAALPGRQELDRLKRGEIAVKAADDVERVGGEIRFAREYGWCIGVVARADAAGVVRRVGGIGERAVQDVHSAASFSAPPQLEP